MLTRATKRHFPSVKSAALGDRLPLEVDLRQEAMRFWPTPFRLFCLRTFTAALAVALLLATLCQAQAADPEPKRVLMLHSYGLRFKPWTDYAEGIRSEINRKSKAPIDYHDHSLLNARQGADNSDDPFVDYLGAVYSKNAPDLIIAFGAPAASFVQQYRERLFPGKPMLFTAIEGRRVQLNKLTENDTVVATHNDFAAAFENLLHVLPDTKTIVIVNGVSPNEKYWEGELRRELSQFSNRVELKWFTELSFEDILKRAANLPPHTAIFWHLMNVDAAGVTHEQNTALNRLTSSANAPTFSFLDVFFGDGLLGGSMQSVQEGSELAAAVALRVLGGEKAGDIKTPPTENALPKYDWRQLQRWNISESRLPPGSKVLFREPTAWEQYWWQIALVVTVMLVQAGLISTLLQERRRRQIAEVQSRRRMAELAHVNRFSTAGELTASIAHEINQPLGAILTNAETADAILSSPSPDIAELKDIVKDILQDDRRASEVIRRMRSLLKKAPFELKNLDLNDLVRETVEFLSALAIARKFELVSAIAPDTLPILGDRIQLQQVILNLVVNGSDAMRDTPSESRIISIQTSRVENFAELSVSDRGSGIPDDKLKEVFEPFFTSKAEGMGMGLSIARTIVEAHHGLIWANNRDHGGATFRARFPLCSHGAGPS
jgi:signal transduction histidine kinase